jgi:hypothetical protein
VLVEIDSNLSPLSLMAYRWTMVVIMTSEGIFSD